MLIKIIPTDLSTDSPERVWILDKIDGKINSILKGKSVVSSQNLSRVVEIIRQEIVDDCTFLNPS